MLPIFECNNVFEIFSDKARPNLLQLQTHIWPTSLYLPHIVLIFNKIRKIYKVCLYIVTKAHGLRNNSQPASN